MDLNFETVDLSMEFEQTTHFTSNGYDEVEFLISTNPGETPKPLGKIASGGELSRIMLALKTVLANNDEIETLIFDEIDTGISGRTAQKVSEKMDPTEEIIRSSVLHTCLRSQLWQIRIFRSRKPWNPAGQPQRSTGCRRKRALRS